MQAWDPDAGAGALLAFRQGSADEQRRIALENVPPGQSFELTSAPDSVVVGTFTSEQLRTGIDVHIAQPEGARVLLIKPAP